MSNKPENHTNSSQPSLSGRALLWWQKRINLIDLERRAEVQEKLRSASFPLDFAAQPSTTHKVYRAT